MTIAGHFIDIELLRGISPLQKIKMEGPHFTMEYYYCYQLYTLHYQIRVVSITIDFPLNVTLQEKDTKNKELVLENFEREYNKIKAHLIKKYKRDKLL